MEIDHVSKSADGRFWVIYYDGRRAYLQRRLLEAATDRPMDAAEEIICALCERLNPSSTSANP